jgi:hypothetical protein
MAKCPNNLTVGLAFESERYTRGTLLANGETLRVCLVQLWIPENLIFEISCGKAAV